MCYGYGLFVSFMAEPFPEFNIIVRPTEDKMSFATTSMWVLFPLIFLFLKDIKHFTSKPTCISLSIRSYRFRLTLETFFMIYQEICFVNPIYLLTFKIIKLEFGCLQFRRSPCVTLMISTHVVLLTDLTFCFTTLMERHICIISFQTYSTS